MLRLIEPATLARAAADGAFQHAYDVALADLDAARRAGHTWWAETYPDLDDRTIAYFSAEFALHQSLPIYAGGLGVLAGDHCKEASDLGVPLVGIGFMYPQGYFHQHISAEGWQEESYEKLSWTDAPIEPALCPDGRHCVVPVPLGDRSVQVAVWCVRLGRVRAVSARHGSRGERALGPRAFGAALWRRSRDARPAGDHPRDRRRPRAAGAGPDAGDLSTSTKAMPPSSCCSASASGSTPGGISTARSPRCGRRPSSPHTRRCRQDTTRFPSSWSRSTWQAAGARSASIAPGSWRSASTTTAAARSST